MRIPKTVFLATAALVLAACSPAPADQQAGGTAEPGYLAVADPAVTAGGTLDLQIPIDSGAASGLDPQLADPNASRRHAELRLEGAAYWIIDLDSTNGLEVNGRRLKRAKLEDGDRIVLGSTELTFARESDDE